MSAVDGLFASQLFAEPLDAAIDLNPTEVKRARRSGMYLQAEVASATAIPFPAGSFASVFSNGVLEHVNALPAALVEIARVLRQGGHLIATTSCAHFSELISLPSLTNRLFGHVNLMEPEAWATALSSAGLHLIESRCYNPAAAIRAHQWLLPSSIGATVVRRMTGRWVFSPALRRSFIAPFWARILRPRYATSAAVGGSICWIAEKR
ncbi:MAG: class I SAM-dependent methyltransferase [Gemmatimonadota bacterium]|nr:class I SAM-dependent methyltransferase [Gemmatimonadota bacterium]